MENVAVLAMSPRTAQRAKMNINAFTAGKMIILQEVTPVKKYKKNIRPLSKDVKMYPNNQDRKQNQLIKACSINICGFSTRSQFALNHFVYNQDLDWLAVQETETVDSDKLHLQNMTAICDMNKAKNFLYMNFHQVDFYQDICFL